MVNKKEIEDILNRFAQIAGQSVIEKLSEVAVEEARVKIEIKNLKIEGELSEQDSIKMLDSIRRVFSRIFGSSLVEGIILKEEKQ